MSSARDPAGGAATSLAPGARLGPYQITAELGRGGMGEVWRAQDTRLDREVALKLLPEDVAEDPERHARFEREAKVLASLNHPNIATLFGFEHLDGQHVLVMELVEGEGLDERIARGVLPLEDVLHIALQLAEALEAAHEHGIVHRDLKPANVKVRPDGAVKVLDFGLAKTWVTESQDDDVLLSPTITRQHTRAGVILGTAAYMSPEQAKGRPADRRSDIWAFGVLLHEMLTGKRLFAGDSVVETLAGVLTADVELGALPPEVPTEVRRLLRRCLERDPRRRLHDIADARIVIEEVLAGADNRDPVTAEPGRAVRPRSRTAAAAWLASVVLAAAVAALATHLASSGRLVPPAPMRFAIRFGTHQELLTRGDAILAFAPDGESLLVGGKQDGQQELLRRDLATGDIEAVAGTDGASAPFPSPDGHWVGFFTGSSYMKVPVDGGRPFTLGASRSAGGAAWLPDGGLVVAPVYSDGLFLVPPGGGEAERLTTPDRAQGELGHWWPDPLPGAHKVLFTAFRTPVDRSRIGVLDLATRQVRWVVEGGFFGRYVATGHLLYAKGQRLYAVPFDPGTATLAGPAVAVLDDLRVSQTSGTAMYAVSRQGMLAYVTESAGNPLRELVWLDRSGRAKPAAEGQRFLSVSLAPDGRRAAVTIGQESLDLWTYSFARGTLSRLTSGEGTEFGPVWSSDGSELFYVVDRPPFTLYRIPVDSPDAGKPIWDEPSELDTNGVAVAPGGHWLAFVRTGQQTGGDLYSRPLDGSQPARPFRAGSAEEGYPSFSPDGRWLAYQSDETGRPEVYVEQFPGPGKRIQISADGGTEPVWARGSGEIFFRHGEELCVVATHLDHGFQFDAPRTLFTYPFIGGVNNSRSYDVSADGSRILAVSIPESLIPRQIEVVTGWAAQLPTLAPATGK